MTALAVERPGAKIRCSLALAHTGGLLCGDDALLDGLVPQPVGIDAGPVVRDLDVDLAALVVRAEDDMTFRGLARGSPVCSILDAVVDRVADQVRQRILGWPR